MGIPIISRIGASLDYCPIQLRLASKRLIYSDGFDQGPHVFYFQLNRQRQVIAVNDLGVRTMP